MLNRLRTASPLTVTDKDGENKFLTRQSLQTSSTWAEGGMGYHVECHTWPGITGSNSPIGPISSWVPTWGQEESPAASVFTAAVL